MEEESPESSSRVLRSSIHPQDWSKCLFCKNRTYKKEKVMQNVSTIEAAKTVRQSAEAKGDQDMLRLLSLGINMDLFASGAKYHKTCFASYVSKSNLKSRAFKDEAGQESAYDKSFLEKASELRKGLESGKAYDMSSLLKKYIGLLEKRGILWFKLHQSEIEASHEKPFR